MSDVIQNMLRSLLVPTADDCRRVDWRPAVDIYGTRRGWLVKFDLAGVRPQEIELVAHGQRLIVRGVRRDFALEEGHRCHSLEISYNRFERTVELPCNVEAAQVSTDYRDGMLLVYLQLENPEG